MYFHFKIEFNQSRFVLIIAILTACALMPTCFGCAISPDPACQKGMISSCRVPGVFRGEWDDYYERGLSCLAGGCYEQALADFNAAIQLRSDDQRLARTYGMHFIDYFPHRESGMIHYLLGDLDSAEKSLKRSIKNTPSAKAKYFLNLTRQERLQRQKIAPKSPAMNLSFPGSLVDADNVIWTRMSSFVVTGTVEDESFVASMMLTVNNGETVAQLAPKSAVKRLSFRKTLALAQGEHALEITAQNLLNAQVVHLFTIHIDRSGPVIAIEQAEFELVGHLNDPAGGMTLTVNGQSVDLPAGPSAAFSLSMPGSGPVKLTAADRLGNRTEMTLPQRLSRLEQEPIYLAQTVETSTDGGLPAVLSSGPLIRIHLKGWPEQETVFVERAMLAGEAVGKDAVVQLTVNGESILCAPGRRVGFNQSIPLATGKNELVFRAVDKRGRKTEKRIIVFRKIPSILKLEHRLRLAVCLVNDCLFGPKAKNKSRQSGLAQPKPALFGSLFMERLAQRKRFYLMEAPPRLRKLSSQATLVSEWIETTEGIEVVARVIDNRTSRILATVDTFDVHKDQAALASLARNLSDDLHNVFPLTKGKIVQVEDNQCVTSLQPDQNPPPIGWPLLIYRPKAPRKNPVTGVSLGADATILDNSVVEGLSINGLKARGADGVRKGDWMIVR